MFSFKVAIREERGYLGELTPGLKSNIISDE